MHTQDPKSINKPASLQFRIGIFVLALVLAYPATLFGQWIAERMAPYFDVAVQTIIH